MITFSRAIGIFFAGIFSGYGADARCSARRFPNPQSSPFRVRQGRPLGWIVRWRAFELFSTFSLLL